MNYIFATDSDLGRHHLDHLGNVLDPPMRWCLERLVSPARGISWTWARETADRMSAAGLVDVRTMEYSETTTGGSDGCLLHRNLNHQVEPLLLSVGATPEELTRYRELMVDPRFQAWSTSSAAPAAGSDDRGFRRGGGR